VISIYYNRQDCQGVSATDVADGHGEKKQGAGWKMWDMGLQISDCGLLILLSLLLAHLI